jgi:hypothetical protein
MFQSFPAISHIHPCLGHVPYNPRPEPPAPQQPLGVEVLRSSSVPPSLAPHQPLRPPASRLIAPRLVNHMCSIREAVRVLPDIVENWCGEHLFRFWEHVENKCCNTLLNVYGTEILFPSICPSILTKTFRKGVQYLSEVSHVLCKLLGHIAKMCWGRFSYKALWHMLRTRFEFKKRIPNTSFKHFRQRPKYLPVRWLTTRGGIMILLNGF